MTDVFVAIIVGIFGLIGSFITAKSMSNKVQKQLEISQAVTDTKIENLTAEVRKHNNFAQRMPVVENEIKHIEADITKLQKYHTN